MELPIVGVLLVALVCAACTGDGSDSDPSASTSTASTAPPPATAPASSAPPTTTMAESVAVARATLAGLPERSDDAVIVDAAAATTGPSVVVGRIEDAASASVRPFALMSRNGRSWARAELPLGTYASGEASAAGATADGVVAAGTVRAADGSSAAASWVRVGRRWDGPFSTEPLATSSVTVTDIDVGAAGAVLLARSGGRGAIWLSADGRLWSAAPPDWDATRDAVAVAVGEAVVVLTRTQDQRGFVDTGVLVGQIGQPLEAITPFGRRGRSVVSDIVAIPDGFLAVGGARAAGRRGDLEPAVWQSPDGRAWRRVRRAIPSLDAPESSLGTILRFVDVGPAGVVAASELGGVWRSRDGRRFVEVPSAVIADDPVAVAATPAPVVASASRLFAFADGRWTTPARRQLPVGGDSTTVSGVTNVDGIWYAVGARSRASRRQADGTVTDGIVWRSDDGKHWERLADGRALAGLSLAAITGTDRSLIAVGTGTDGAKDGVGQVLRSRNGRRWRATSSPDLVAPEGGVHQLEAVAPAPGGGAVATGYAFDGVDIRPLVLRVPPGGAVERATRGLNVAPGDAVTVCTSGDTSLVAGVTQGGSSAAQGWTSRNLRRWRPTALGRLSRADACAGGGGRFVVAGAVFRDRGLGTAAIVGHPDAFTSIALDDDTGLPHGVAMSNDVVVIVGSSEADGVVWIGDDRRVDRLEFGELTGPGSQTIEAVAVAGGRAVMVGSALGQAAIWVADLP